jgi:alpha-L-fucosidase
MNKRVILSLLCSVVINCVIGQYNPTFEQGLGVGKLDLKQDSVALDKALEGWWTASQTTLDKRMEWYNEAKFGCFVHWGPYAETAGIWDGKPFSGYSEHLMRVFKIPIQMYKEKVVATFDPVEFDADEWMRQVKAAGMKYFIITAKHHDGFFVGHSDAYPYDMRKTPYHKNPLIALRDAARKYQIKFGFYYSHAFDWEHPDAPGNDWDFPGHPGGDRLVNGRNWWLKMPEFLENTQRYLDEKALPQLKELIVNYDPDILWFDTPHKIPFYQNMQVLQFIRALSPNLVVNGRLANYNEESSNFGDYLNTADRPEHLLKPAAKYWECIPTTNESYGYSAVDKSHKSPQFFIRLLASAAGKGGNVLMNVGPMGNGKWDPKDVAIFNDIGKWLDINGESIYGSRATRLPLQNWGVTTEKDNKLYLHVYNWPADGKLVINGIDAQVMEAKLLDNNMIVKAKKHDRYSLLLNVPTTCPDPKNTVIVLTLKDGYKVTDSAYLLADNNYLLAFDAQVEGARFGYGDGKRNRHYITNWKDKDQAISWKVRTDQTDSYVVEIEYNTVRESDKGSVFVYINGKPYKVNYVGQNEYQSPGVITTKVAVPVQLKKGAHTIMLKVTRSIRDRLI